MQNFKPENDFGGVEGGCENTEKCLHYRFLIPQAAAGAIISRKGETIRRLRTEFQVEMNVPQNTGPERLLLIYADIEKLCAVLTEIFELVRDCMHAKVNDPKDIVSGFIPENVISEEMDLRFLVSENVCGAIIGKGGEVIRRLTDTYRVSVMKVYQQMCPASTDRVIRLVAAPSDLLACLRAVHGVILGLKDTKSAREYDPEDFNELHAVNYGGWVSLDTRRAMGRRGGPPPATKGPTPSGRTVQEFGGEAEVAVPCMEGLSLMQMAARLRSASILAEMQMCGPPGGMGMGPMVPGQGMQAGPGNQMQMQAAAQMQMEMQMHGMPMGCGMVETSHVSLPNRLIGAIMGRGGTRINEIREEAGARIDVEKTPLQSENEERVITIQGTREQIQTAQYLLQQCVRKYGGKQW